VIREQPFLFASGLWVEIRDGNPTAQALYDRHYSRNRAAIGNPRIVGPGERIVLLTDLRRLPTETERMRCRECLRAWAWLIGFWCAVWSLGLALWWWRA
jgi:hypothetical protein